MKKILTSSITSTARQPFLDYSLSHLQDAYTEAINSLCKRVIPSYTTNDVVVLEGLVDTGTAGVNFNISAGSIYYNGEIYQIPATGVLVIAGNTAVLTLPTTYHTSDPVTMDNGTTAYVHTLRAGVIALATSGSGTKDFTSFKRIVRNSVFAKLTTVGSGAASTSFTLTGWDASPIDDDAIFTIANGRITPKLGRYKVSACVTITPSTSPSGTFDINIYKNGVLLDAVCSETFGGSNAVRNIQFSNYVITQTTATDYYTIVMTTPSGTYTYSSVQLTVEPLGNTLDKAY
jgi:hypothetical protein